MEVFFASRYLGVVRLSPDGTYLAALVRSAGKHRIEVTNVETGASVLLPPGPLAQVEAIYWAGASRLLLAEPIPDTQLWRFGAMDIDGANPVAFARPVAFAAEIEEIHRDAAALVDTPADKPGSVYLAYPDRKGRTGWTHVVVEVDALTGRSREIERAPHAVNQWLSDPEGNLRLTTSQWGGHLDVRYRRNVAAPWIAVGTSRSLGLDDLEFQPLGVAAGKDLIFVAARRESDRFEVYAYDPLRDQFGQKLASHPRVDVTGPLVFSRRTPHDPPQVVGIAYVDDYLEIQWVDPLWQEFQRYLDDALPGLANHVVGVSRHGARALILSESDRTPPVYYLWDMNTKTLRDVLHVFPDLEGLDLVPVERVSYEARDGLRIPAYLAKPDVPGTEPLPLIVIPHGGPWARDTKSFDPVTQFLTSRGWAVFRPNFRGSTGYGLKFQQAGYQQWGLAMQDDITDGVEWLIKTHVADPNRICIFGASYGGFAALVGAVRTPALYRCAAVLAPVTDLTALVRSWTAGPDGRVYRNMVGAVDTSETELSKVSPLSNIQRIRIPVFLAHGELDRTVSVEHTRRFERQLEKHRKRYEALYFPDEGHDILNDRNISLFFSRLEGFLAANIGYGGAERVGVPSG